MIKDHPISHQPAYKRNGAGEGEVTLTILVVSQVSVKQEINSCKVHKQPLKSISSLF